MSECFEHMYASVHTDPSTPLTTIVVPICITVTILVALAVCAVILALYWKFKIKLIRET